MFVVPVNAGSYIATDPSCGTTPLQLATIEVTGAAGTLEQLTDAAFVPPTAEQQPALDDTWPEWSNALQINIALGAAVVCSLVHELVLLYTCEAVCV